MAPETGTVLWWGRFDPDYSRNRVLRQQLAALGWRVVDFQPCFAPWGELEARLRGIERPDLVWVPCFRQRDLAAARRWSRRLAVPLVFDPLISAYDKQVFERERFPTESFRGRRLLHWERALLGGAELVLADTDGHARFFCEVLGAAPEKVRVVPVGAEESLFYPSPGEAPGKPAVPEVLFFGSFIRLQGPQVIIEAARSYQGAPVRWRLIGSGPLLDECRRLAEAAHLDNLVFTPWVPYGELGDYIRRADILLGIFGETAKAGRVIPNKVYQALACGKPVVTRRSDAYPAELLQDDGSGLVWTEAGNSRALAEAVAALAAEPQRLTVLGRLARASYDRYFSEGEVRSRLKEALTLVR